MNRDMGNTTANSPCELRYGDNQSQFVRLHVNGSTTAGSSQDAGHAIVFLIHGGFWKQEYGLNTVRGTASESLAPDLVSRGFSVVEIEYRRGIEWGYPESNLDVLQAIRFSLQRWFGHAARQKFAIVGISAGGQLALWASLELPDDCKPTIIVAIAPVADLEQGVDFKLSDRGDAVTNYMHGTPEEKPQAYKDACPMCRAGELAQLTTKIFLVTGTDDVDVPPRMVSALHRKITSLTLQAGKCILLNAVDHNHYDLMNATSIVWSQVADHVVKELLASPRT